MALDVQWLRSKDRHAVTIVTVSNLRSPSPPLAAFFLDGAVFVKNIFAATFIILSAGALYLFFDIKAEVQKEHDRNFKIQSALYADAASVRIFDEWLCIAPDQSLKFIRHLMEQLAPNDASEIDRIYARKAELKEKEELRALTVLERKELIAPDWNNNGLDGQFAIATCGFDSFTASMLGVDYTQQPCPDKAVASVQNENREITIRYQDRFTRWQLNPARVFEKQFRGLTKAQQQDAINRIYEYEQTKLALEELAQKKVDKTTAILVPEDGEAAFKRTVFLRLFCEKSGAADRQFWAPHNLLNKNGYF